MTVDVDTLDDGAATIRERDSMTQERVALAAIPDRLAALIAGTTAWEGVPRQAASHRWRARRRLASPIRASAGLLAAYDAAFAADRADEVAELFAEDARLQWPEEEDIVGRDAIRRAFTGFVR